MKAPTLSSLFRNITSEAETATTKYIIDGSSIMMTKYYSMYWYYRWVMGYTMKQRDRATFDRYSLQLIIVEFNPRGGTDRPGDPLQLKNNPPNYLLPSVNASGAADVTNNDAADGSDNCEDTHDNFWKWQRYSKGIHPNRQNTNRSVGTGQDRIYQCSIINTDSFNRRTILQK